MFDNIYVYVLQQTVQMERCDWLDHHCSMYSVVVWKFVLKINGTQFVEMPGLIRMQWLFAENWDTLHMVSKMFVPPIRFNIHFMYLPGLEFGPRDYVNSSAIICYMARGPGY